jgi:adenylyltransferase/sulfurtransferase
MEQITVQEFKEKIESGDDVFLLDVRQPFEKYQSSIDYDNSELIPVDDLPGRLNEIKDHKKDEVVCMCRSGSRSSKAAKFLKKKGFKDVKNLKGGINQWAKDIDNSLPVY